MKSLLQNVLLIVFSVFFALAFSEIGLRLAGYKSGNPFERLINNNDEYVGYRMNPGDHERIKGPGGVYDVEIISLGFEDDRGFRDDGREDPVHSIFFGDSFVWGFGVDLSDSVSEQFEALTGRDAINLGMTSFTSPTQYYRLFSQYAPELRAEYAFFGIFLGNDLGDGRNFDKWLLTDKRVSYPEWRTRQIRGFVGNSWINQLRLFAYKNSVLWRFVADRTNFSGDKKLRGGLHEVKTDKLDLVLNPDQIFTSLGHSRDHQVRVLQQVLSQIVRTGRSSGTHPVVFIIPTKELVYQSFFPEGPNRTVEDIRHRILLELLDESGMDYLDLLPIFRQAVADDAEQLYFRVDGHWNPAGHALAASELNRYFRERVAP